MTNQEQPSMYRLYGYSLSYFSRKLEAALDWYGLPYEFCLKTPDVGSELEKRSGTNQVPLLVTPEDDVLIDTTPIMWRLDEQYPDRAMFPSGVMGAVAQALEECLDEWLTRVVMHYRWNFDESTQAAAKTLAKEAAPKAPQVIAPMLTMWGKKVVRARGMTSREMQVEGENEWKRLLEALEAQLGHTPFSLGTRPCGVDAVLLGGLRGHFLPDPVPSRVLTHYPRVSSWITESTRWSGDGALVTSLESCPFAQFMLQEMSGAYRTYILANRDAVMANEKAFVCDTYGHAVSYKSQPYTEKSRLRTCRRLNERLSGTDRDTFLGHLDDYNLGEVFSLRAAL